MKNPARSAPTVRHRLLRCGLAFAAALGAGACGPGEATDPAAVWDPCALPAGLLTEAGFPAESGGGGGGGGAPRGGGGGWGGGGWGGEGVGGVLGPG